MNTRERMELFDHIDRLFVGDLQPHESQQLARQLAEDPEAREFYAQLVRLDVGLAWSFGTQPQLTLAANPAISPSPSLSVSGSPSPEVAPSSRRRFAPSTLAWSILAASLLFAAYFIGISWNMLGKQLASSPDHLSPLAPGGRGARGEGDTVATITASDDATWASLTPASTRGEDADVAPGQPLSITSGLVELQLKQGTTLLIEGPADWQINGENSATLTRGKLVAKVPQQAIGFTLETPTAKIVDLGTEFGVEVNGQGLSEVQVEKGQVEVRTSSPGKTVLSTGQAVRIDANSVQTISADSKRFSKLASALTAESKPVRPKTWVESGLTVFTSLIDRFGTSNAWEKLADRNARQRRVVTSSSSHFPWFAYSPPNAIGFFAIWDGRADVVNAPNLDMRAPGPKGLGAYAWTLFDSQGIGAVPDCAVANLHRIELTWLPLSTAKGKLRILVRDQQGHWFLSEQSLEVLTDGKVVSLDVAATEWKAVSTKLVPLRSAPASLLTLGQRASPEFKRVTGVGIYWAESSDTVNHAARIGSIALIGAEDAKPAKESDIGTTPASSIRTPASR